MNVARRLRLMFGFTAVLLASGLAVNFLADPYGAWGTGVFDPIYRQVKQERLVAPYRLRIARPQTLLLGTSRVLFGMRIEQGERDGVMNAALSAATVPEVSRELALASYSPTLKRVIWGVDFFAFDQARDRINPVFGARIENRFEMRLEDTLLSLSALHDSYELAARAMRGRKRMRATAMAEVPWPMTLTCDDFRATAGRGLASAKPSRVEEELSRDLPDYPRYRFSPRLLQMFTDAVAAARRRGVEVIIFVPPMSQYELELIRQSGKWETFQDFKRKLAAIGPFWDFSGYNRIAASDGLFMHVMHFKTAAGQMILRIVLKDPAPPCDAASALLAAGARYVDAGNVEAHLAEQDRMRAAAMEGLNGARYAQMAARAIVRRDRERIDARPSAFNPEAPRPRHRAGVIARTDRRPALQSVY